MDVWWIHKTLVDYFLSHLIQFGHNNKDERIIKDSRYIQRSYGTNDFLEIYRKNKVTTNANDKENYIQNCKIDKYHF